MMERQAFMLGGREVVFETGVVARQADAAVLLRSGASTVLATIVEGPPQGEAEDFLLLTVDYREKLAAIGRVPGGGQRREGRVLEHETLASRLIDRALRPLFQPGFKNEIQLQVTVFSWSPEDHEPVILGLLAAAAALHLSSLPAEGPVAGLRIADIGGEFRIQPGSEGLAESAADVLAAVTRNGLVMLEARGDSVPEDRLVLMVQEIERAATPILEAMSALRARAGRPKQRDPLEGGGPSPDSSMVAELGRIIALEDKSERRPALRKLLAGQDADMRRRLLKSWSDGVRARILAEGRRLDGRAPDEIRPISITPRFLQRPHGSALFTRGQTQVLATSTLAPQQLELVSDSLLGVSRSRFYLHYNFPAYSVGEVRASRAPGRREIGHGMLAQRALEPVLPPWSKFPFVVRIEAEVTESNGSSSMATVCAASIAMMDAGVPIKMPVAGVAMGMVSDGNQQVALTDILGDEDQVGDFDLKIAGTEAGVTALQFDNKRGVVGIDSLRLALLEGRTARLKILEQMASAMPAPRSELAPGVPRTATLRIPEEAVGLLIGPKGQTIKGLQSELNVEIDVNDAGVVNVTATDAPSLKAAKDRIRDLVGVVTVGKLYRGRIVSVRDFGAIVCIYESSEGLVPLSEWDQSEGANFSAEANEGQDLIVRVLGVDPRGRIRLSRKSALTTPDELPENG